MIAPTVLRDCDVEVRGSVSPYGVTIHRVTTDDGAALALTDAEEAACVEALVEAADEAVRMGCEEDHEAA